MTDKKKKNKNKGGGNKVPGRLIYPMETPRGPVGDDGSISPDRRYQPKTIDYLKLKIYDTEKNNPYTYSGKGKGTQSKQEQIKETVYLYLPHDLTESYTTSYDKVALGPFGEIAVEAMRSGNTQGVAEAIQSGAKSAMPEVVYKGVSDLFNGASQFAGVSGGMNKNQLSALAKGRVFNPYEETVFKGTNYRSHNFTFDMAPRNAKEAQNIVKIITTLREAMLPGMSGANNRWLTIPNFFRAEVIRYNPRRFNSELKASGAGNLSAPETLSTVLTYPVNMVLTNMQVNLTPSGQNTSIRDPDFSGIDYGPAQYRLQLTFDEMAFLVKNMYTGKDGKNNSLVP